jgi:hypothetical protein
MGRRVAFTEAQLINVGGVLLASATSKMILQERLPISSSALQIRRD